MALTISGIEVTEHSMPAGDRKPRKPRRSREEIEQEAFERGFDSAKAFYKDDAGRIAGIAFGAIGGGTMVGIAWALVSALHS